MVTNNCGPTDLVSPSCFSMATDFQENICNSGSIRMNVQLQQQQQPTQMTNSIGQQNSR